MNKFSNDVLNSITMFNDTGLNLITQDHYDNYLKSGYIIFVQLFKKRFPNIEIPNSDRSNNWNYEYHNLS